MTKQQTNKKTTREDDRYQAAFEGNTTALLIMEATNGNIIDANPAAQELYGYTLEQFKKLSWLDLTALPERAAKEMLRQVRNGEQACLDSPHCLRDGVVQMMHCNVTSFIRNGQHLLLCMLHASAGNATKNFDARTLSAALRAVPHGVMITNAAGVIQWTNPGLSSMTGYDAHELIGYNPNKLRSGVQTSAQYQELWNTIIAGDTWKGNLINRRKDGSHYAEEQTITPVKDESGNVQHFIAMKQDVTARQADREELHNRAQKQQALAELSHAALQNDDVKQLANQAGEIISSILEPDFMNVLRLNLNSNVFTLWAGSGWPDGIVGNFQIANDPTDHAGYTMLSDEPLISRDLPNETRFRPAELLVQLGVKHSIGVPIDNAEETYGILGVHFTEEKNLTSDDLVFLQAIANTLAAAIRQDRYKKRLQASHARLLEAYDSTIEGLAKALDLRDHETEGHSRRVTNLSVALARKLGLNEMELTSLRRGALLHDIGKMGIPDAILHKPGPLDAAERQHMQKHTTLARDLLNGISFLEDSIDIPLSHHEKWDGTGYPRGLKGKEIPLNARIFAVVDVYDALTNRRPYREAWSVTEALEYIHSQAGTHFDPAVSEAFIDMMQETSADAE